VIVALLLGASLSVVLTIAAIALASIIVVK